jgi:hypothetical protein
MKIIGVHDAKIYKILNVVGLLSVADKYVLIPLKRPISPKEIVMKGNVSYFCPINLFIFLATVTKRCQL